MVVVPAKRSSTWYFQSYHQWFCKRPQVWEPPIYSPYMPLFVSICQFPDLIIYIDINTYHIYLYTWYTNGIPSTNGPFSILEIRFDIGWMSPENRKDCMVQCSLNSHWILIEGWLNTDWMIEYSRKENTHFKNMLSISGKGVQILQKLHLDCAKGTTLYCREFWNWPRCSNQTSLKVGWSWSMVSRCVSPNFMIHFHSEIWQYDQRIWHIHYFLGIYHDLFILHKMGHQWWIYQWVPPEKKNRKASCHETQPSVGEDCSAAGSGWHRPAGQKLRP